MEKITISKRQKRLLSSLLFVLEQKTESIEHMLNHNTSNASYDIIQDIDLKHKDRLLNYCAQLKQKMQSIAELLDLPRRQINQVQFINTIQSQMWENITDAFSSNLKGYGEDVINKAKYADPFVQQLSDEIDKLKIQN